MPKYKAIISDVDGTLTPLVPNALPSQKVTNTIKEAMDKGLIFGLATGRPFHLIEYLTEHLNLTSPAITDNGAVITDTKDNSVLWEAILPNIEAQDILDITNEYGFTRISTDLSNSDNPITIPNNQKVRKISIHDLLPNVADELIEKINTRYKDLAVVKAASYKGESHLDIYISNAKATKQHAVLKYAQLLGISTHEIIGVGDGYNDFPLMMACGLKVAMGNAVDELKEIADYVAPNVHQDGLADVIERYILK